MRLFAASNSAAFNLPPCLLTHELRGVLPVRQGIFKNTLVRGPVGFKLDDETKSEVDRQFDRMIAAVESVKPAPK